MGEKSHSQFSGFLSHFSLFKYNSSNLSSSRTGELLPEIM